MAAKVYPGREPRQKSAQGALGRAVCWQPSRSVLGGTGATPAALPLGRLNCRSYLEGDLSCPGAAISPLRARTGGSNGGTATGSGICGSAAMTTLTTALGLAPATRLVSLH